ncbi:hypothetical protein LFM09_11970 [Lentzea alba]|uniref:hypothetical protein n=1 Tax=Lentzea alba TaxID=2714351 RepID=UPI0039BF861A
MPRALVLLLCLLIAGCAEPPPERGDLQGTLQRLSEAGYDWTSVGHSQPAPGQDLVLVELRTKSEPAEQAADRAAKLVWTTHKGPLDAVAVEVNGVDTLVLNRTELVTRFGARDRQLDALPKKADWTGFWSVVIGVAGVFAVGLLAFRLWRRARS